MSVTNRRVATSDVQPDNAQYTSHSYGPTFGGGHCLTTDEKLTTVKSSWNKAYYWVGRCKSNDENHVETVWN
jgi:hypothetical protein